jgi:hypothetical protein
VGVSFCRRAGAKVFVAVRVQGKSGTFLVMATAAMAATVFFF